MFYIYTLFYKWNFLSCTKRKNLVVEVYLQYVMATWKTVQDEDECLLEYTLMTNVAIFREFRWSERAKC